MILQEQDVHAHDWFGLHLGLICANVAVDRTATIDGTGGSAKFGHPNSNKEPAEEPVQI